MTKITIGCKSDKTDGTLYFKTKEGLKGHIVLHMTDSVIINTKTNELTITNFHHEMPRVFAEEIFINLISDFFEVHIEPIELDHIEITCKFIEKKIPTMEDILND